MARRGRKPNKVTVPPIVEPADEREATRTARVIAIFQEICERWAQGKSMEQIASELGLGTGTQVRKVIENNRALRVVLEEYNGLRADSLHEKAIVWAHQASEIKFMGLPTAQGLRVAIDTVLKVAAQLKPKTYGDVKKTEIRDNRGHLVGTETTTANVTPGEAYERMLKRGEA